MLVYDQNNNNFHIKFACDQNSWLFKRLFDQRFKNNHILNKRFSRLFKQNNDTFMLVYDTF